MDQPYYNPNTITTEQSVAVAKEFCDQMAIAGERSSYLGQLFRYRFLILSTIASHYSHIVELEQYIRSLDVVHEYGYLSEKEQLKLRAFDAIAYKIAKNTYAQVYRDKTKFPFFTVVDALEALEPYYVELELAKKNVLV